MPSFRSLFRATPRPAHNAEPADEPPASPDSTQLWRRAPVQVSPLGTELSAVQTHSSQAVHVLPSEAVEWTLGCTDWRTLEEHLERHDLETFTRVLPELLKAGLLVSQADMEKWCRTAPAQEPKRASIAAIGFPTGGEQGLELLPRAVRSFADNLREYGRSAELLVCDSSLDTALREGFRTRLRALADELGRPIRYAGVEENQQSAQELVERGACSPEVAEFALGDPLETGFAPGANRNMMLLDQAGAMFCSVDHDVLCRTTRAPEGASGSLSFFSDCDPFARWTFADRAEADRATRWETPDHLALHESMLGRGIHELFPEQPGAVTLDFSRATDALIERLATGPARVRATFCGHAGEPGVPSAVYYLAYRGNNRARLTCSEAHYRAALTSKNLLALSPTPAIGDASLSPGVAFGMDHREILPPFFPVLHAEDFSWSALAWQCCPGAVMGLLPWAVAHEPIPGKAFLHIGDLAKLPPFVIWEWAHVLRFWTRTWQPPAEAEASERIRGFGRRLEEIARLSPEDFTAELRRVALATASHQVAFYESQLYSEAEELPDFWRADVETYLAHIRRAVTRDGFELPLDLQQRCGSLAEARTFAQRLTGRYAALLAVWPDMVAAAGELRQARL